jgi:hypothetical protein
MRRPSIRGRIDGFGPALLQVVRPELGFVLAFDVDEAAAMLILVSRNPHQLHGEAIVDQELQGRSGAAVEVSCNGHEPG